MKYGLDVKVSEFVIVDAISASGGGNQILTHRLEAGFIAMENFVSEGEACLWWLWGLVVDGAHGGINLFCAMVLLSWPH